MIAVDWFPSQPCAPEALPEEHARALAEALAREALPFARLVSCAAGASRCVVVMEVDAEVPQRPVHDIRMQETIAAVFFCGRDWRVAPEVYALREGFPGDAPHLNLWSREIPRSLCLYETPFRDYRGQWTPGRFVARIREWLRLTARGELHAADQPLEPLLGEGNAWVFLPNEVRTATGNFAAVIADSSANTPSSKPLRLELTECGNHRGLPVYIAEQHDGRQSGTPIALAAVVRVAPRLQAALRRTPATLADLQGLLALEGDDLLATLRKCFRAWELAPEDRAAKFTLIILVPKLRTVGGAIEDTDAWVMVTGLTVHQLGAAIGVWTLDGPGAGGWTLPIPEDKNGSDVRLLLAYAFFSFTRLDAAEVSGRGSPEDKRLTAVGVGAIGSQVYLNAIRGAFGRWTLIDEDLLLPHNLARHALPPATVAIPKAFALADLGNHLVPEDPTTLGIVADVLSPGDQRQAVHDALEAADAILDFSASVTVARMLARDCTAKGRRLSVFLNPSGTDLTILTEDIQRTIPLDSLEMQYYRMLHTNSGLRDSLSQPSGRVRYGGSCRDVSVQLPQPRVALHAAIATQAIEQSLSDNKASVRVWHLGDGDLSVEAYRTEPAPVVSCAVGEWTFVTDEAFLGRLRDLRKEKLQNETGGVLLGAFDLIRKIVYLVETVPSPPDSEEWPTVYIRGASGLAAKVAEIERVTAGQVHYIGEWHSHPDGSTCHPSTDDAQVFSWLTEAMDTDGLPALMMIVGDRGQAVTYFGTMVRDGKYPGVLPYPEDGAGATA